jgi:hypothetical protein
MFRTFTPRHRLTLRVFIGVACVIVLLATACGTGRSGAPAGVRPAGVSTSAVPVPSGSASMR